MIEVMSVVFLKHVPDEVHHWASTQEGLSSSKDDLKSNGDASSNANDDDSNSTSEAKAEDNKANYTSTAHPSTGVDPLRTQIILRPS